MTPNRSLGRRVLEFSRDPLFAAIDPVGSDWVATGRRLEPAGRAGRDKIPAPVQTIKGIIRALRGQYDLIVFPAIRLWTPGDSKNRKKRWSRALLVSISGLAIVRRVIRAVFRLGRTTYVIRDVGDFPEIEEISTKLFGGAGLYLKREVLEEDLGRRLQGGTVVTYTPMPFDISSYPTPQTEKSIDVFFAARDYGAYRMRARDVLLQLSRESVLVDMPNSRLPFDEYLYRLSRAWLVVSPRGQGEHCYRHYEALLMGAVPLINRPDRSVHYDLTHGESALFYDPAGDGLHDMIISALEDRARLRTIAEVGAELVRSRHSKDAICRAVLARLAALPDE